MRNVKGLNFFFFLLFTFRKPLKLFKNFRGQMSGGGGQALVRKWGRVPEFQFPPPPEKDLSQDQIHSLYIKHFMQ